MFTRSTTTLLPDDFASSLRRRFVDNFVEHSRLAGHTAAGVGGVADYLVFARSAADLVDAVELAEKFSTTYTVIGGGSSVLVSDVGIPGLVIINRASAIWQVGESQIVVESGANNLALVNWAAARGLGGIEYLSAIPGTVGGALTTDATFDKQSIASHVKSVTLLASNEGKLEVKTYAFGELRTGLSERINSRDGRTLFRKSFAGGPNPPVILALTLQLALLSQDDLLRRIRNLRQRSKLWLNGNRRYLGAMFAEASSNGTSTEQSTSPLVAKIQRRLLDSHGLRLIDGKRHIIAIRKGCLAADIRARLEQYQQELAALGVQLEERLDYLGYWPKHEES